LNIHRIAPFLSWLIPFVYEQARSLPSCLGTICTYSAYAEATAGLMTGKFISSLTSQSTKKAKYIPLFKQDFLTFCSLLLCLFIQLFSVSTIAHFSLFVKL